VTAVALACASALLFGSTSVAIRVGLRRGGDAELGALSSAVIGLVVCVVAAAVAREGVPLRDTLDFFLAGLFAPGVSQVLFFRAIQDSGAARVSVVVGTAPLFSVAIAILLLGEPVQAALLVGAILIVAGGAALAGERVRPHDFRLVGLAAALGCTVFFASRDNLVRWLSGDTSTPPFVAAAATFLGGALVMTLYLLATRRRRAARGAGRSLAVFLPASLAFGLSYACLFQAYYRGRVTVVSPLVATESLWGVLLAALVLRRTELVGRQLVLGAALVVAGGALIGAFR
jgi:drug/metabolite transporter (DMT)-like permease